MAVYEFECGSCGEQFEVSVPISQHDQLKQDPPACPKCQKKETKQIVSIFSCKTPSGY